MLSTVVLASLISLNGEWQLDYWPQPDREAVRTPASVPKDAPRVKATVPGNCELDLIAAGILPPSEVGLNARKLRPYEGYQWLYTRTFDRPEIPAGGRVVLRFDGIDTLADIFLNGEKIGETANMLIPHRFDVTDRLKDGANVVQVLIRSVMCESREQTIGELGYAMTGGATGEPFRKAAHMGGWDIFPRIYASGLWRDVLLEIDGEVRIDQTAWIVRHLDAKKGEVDLIARGRVQAPFRMLDHMDVRVRLERNGKVVAENRGPMDSFWPNRYLRVSGASLWWPAGMGESALYDASIAVVDKDDKVLAEKREKIGLRTIELVRDDIYDKDRPGQFLFKVNGEPCYVRGANWVPLDAYPSRQAGRIRETLEMFTDLNCNMVRVWGGGVYEPEAFFDYCDEHGIMVWQDFMTGCSVFPQSDAYAAATREEVLAIVLKYRNRASLALWSGNNENDQAHTWVLWRRLARDPNLDRNSRRTIPAVLHEFDVTRPYLPSSPYWSPDVFAGKARPSEDHLWGAREYYKTPYYTNSPAWFVSEMGYHGCPNRASLEKMMTAECVYPWTSVTGKDPKRDYHWNLEWQFKASDPKLQGFGSRRNSLMTNQIKLMFGDVPTDLDAFIEQSQFVQAEAMKTFCELFRSRKFTRMNGLVWWNVRDGWPQISDAVVDWYGGKKLAYDVLKNAQRNQIVCLIDDHTAWAVNDERRAVKGTATFTDAATGKVLLETSFEIPANGKFALGTVPFDGQGIIKIAATLDGKPYRNHFLYGEPPFDFGQIKEWMK